MARLFFLEGGKKEGKVRAQCSLGRAIWCKEEEDVGGLRMEGGGGWSSKRGTSVLSTQQGSIKHLETLLYSSLEVLHQARILSMGTFLSECCGSASVENTGGGSRSGGIRPIRLTHETS